MKAQIIYVEHYDLLNSRTTVLASTEDLVLAQRLRTHITNAVEEVLGEDATPGSQSPGRPGKRVIVTSVGDEQTPPAGVNVDETYSSASELSLLLGYKRNAVAQALMFAHRKGESVASLKGVAFRYV